MRIRVVNPIDRDFGMVPRVLWETSLPFAAKGVAAYLFCLRDGALPYVGEIEATLGIGRDARRKAFAALEAAGVIRWLILKDAVGRVTGKTLQLHPENLRAPENPAGGKSTSLATDFRLHGDGFSGDNLKERKKESAAKARGSVRSAQRGGRSGLDVSGLSPFLRSRIRSGQTVIVNGVVVLRGSPEMARLQEAMKQAKMDNAYEMQVVR